MKRFNSFLKIFYFYLALSGTIGFTAFIIEEAEQSITFSMFMVKDMNRWDIGKRNIAKMTTLNNHLKLVVKYLLWINPLQYYAYKDYASSTDSYIETASALMLANGPEVYVGDTISTFFYYKSAIYDTDGVTLRSGKIQTKVFSPPETNPVYVTGILTKIGDFSFEIVPEKNINHE